MNIILVAFMKTSKTALIGRSQEMLQLYVCPLWTASSIYIDLAIEEYDGKLHGYEFKWQKQKYKVLQIFLDTYYSSSVTLINNDYFWDFLLEDK